MKYLLALFTVIGVSTITLPLRAQTATTSVSGTVTDSSRGVVVGANVAIQSLKTGLDRQTRSNGEGFYSFPQLPPGNYKLSISFTGFADVVIESLELPVNTPVSRNVVLATPSAVSTSVTVTDREAPLNTTDATLGHAFDTRPILQLPLNARNVTGLLSLQTGVTFISDDTLDDRYKDARNGSVNGARSDQSNITLDGVDVNDQELRLPFTSVLRNTLDSVQEFRVTTTNANADQGRSSGAQVSLITKSGTNEWHGSAYEFHRNTLTAANDFFNNTAGVERAKLIRNVFGASLGAPIRRNRLFVYGNFERRRDASEQSSIVRVPTAAYRNGTLSYLDTAGRISQLTAADVRRLDPLGIGINPATQAILNSYPLPNDTSVGDGLNSAGYRFTSPTPLRWNTYIARLDWIADRSGRHIFFLRGNLQNDRASGASYLPGQPPATVSLENSKGIAAGYNHVLAPSLTGTFRYGFTRQSPETTGLQNAPILLAFSGNFLDGPIPSTTNSTNRWTVQTISEDLTRKLGRHTLQFGGIARVLRNARSTNAFSFSTAASDTSSAMGGINGFADLVGNVDPTFAAPFSYALSGYYGALYQGFAVYNYNIDGTALPPGATVRRNYGYEEYETYVQDSWKIRPNLTVVGGLRWSLMPPVHELNGIQGSIIPDYGDFVGARLALAEEGRPTREAGPVRIVQADSPLGKPLFPFHKKNFAPRLSIAWSPDANDGFWRKLTGGPNNTSIRAGAGVFYEIFGTGIINTLDQNSPGLSSTLNFASGQYSLATAPRYVSINQVPAVLSPPAPPGGFNTPEAINAAGGTVDQQLKPPYTVNLDFSVARRLPGGYSVEATYVGRLSHRQLIIEDAAGIQANLRDPKSNTYLWDAFNVLERQARANVPTANVAPVPFWQNIYSNAAGNGLTATQSVYDFIRQNSPNNTFTMYGLDVTCTPFCSDFGPNTFFNPQFGNFLAYRSVANASYHSGQFSLRKRFSAGYQFDLNYTFSKSIDLMSLGDRGLFNRFGNFSSDRVYNALRRRQNRAPSDFDMRHQLNANWVAELPFGRNKPLLASVPRLVNAVIGGWQASGIVRLTSGLPANVYSGGDSTDLCCGEFAVPTGSLPEQTSAKNVAAIQGGSGPNIFSDPEEAFSRLQFPLVGNIGNRNMLRENRYFSADVGLSKRFALPIEGHTLQIRAEAFNVTNSVTFDSSYWDLLTPSTFGRYSKTLVPSRVIQFGMRYDF